VVFRDARAKKVQSYAIMGKELIDVSGGLMRRYPLDDVDVKATMKRIRAWRGFQVAVGAVASRWKSRKPLPLG